jgi:hypothetical protein
MQHVLLAAALLLLAAGCVAPASHLRLFCVPTVAVGDGRIIEGLLCNPVPDDVPTETAPRPERATL